MNRKTSIITVAITLLTGIVGCDEQPLSGPPVLRLGRDECAECGMMIQEDRCSSAVLIERTGRREYAAFDDIGCMLKYQQSMPSEVQLVSSYVHDYDTRQWVTGSEPWFLVADREKLATPMASGVVAFADDAAANRARAQFGGQVVRRSELAGHRPW